jgi:hypothetical protein
MEFGSQLSVCAAFYKMLAFYGDGLIVARAVPNLETHPLLAIRYSTYFKISFFSCAVKVHLQPDAPYRDWKNTIFFSIGATAPGGSGPTHCRGFVITLTYTHPHSVGRRDLYLTTHNTHKRQTATLPAGFEPTIPTSERTQTHALDRAATGIGERTPLNMKNTI